MLICALVPAAARRFSISSSISASLTLIRLTTSRSRTRSTMHLVADVVAELGVVDAFLAQPLAQLRQRQLVLGRDVGDGAVDLGLVDARAALARVGDQHALVDQRVEHLLAQRRRRRQGLRVARRLVAHARQPLLHLGRGDQLLVDDGDDVVAGLGERRARRRGREPAAASDAPAEEFQVSHTE